MDSDDTVTLIRSPAASPSPALAGQVVIPRELGHVRLLRELGRGAMGVVWLGHDTLLDRRVAVKFLLNAASGPEDPGFERFLQGARAAARVRHPALAGLHHAEVVNAIPYLVMEFIDGVTLADVLATTGPLPPAAAACVLQAACGAVGELHEEKIVHRDLKPANILLEGTGRVFVTDFGLACGRTPPGGASAGAGSGGGPVSGSGGALAVVAGTPAYMAPEAFEGAITPRSDVYALGVMTFQLLTGRLPFTAESWQAVRDQHRDRPLPLESLREHGAPDGWIEVIERATHKNALFRYKSAHAFWRAIESAAGPGGVPRRPEAELSVLLAHHRGGGGPGPGPAITVLAPPSDRPANSYPEMISQLADAKRKVKPVRPVGLDGGSDYPPPPAEDRREAVGSTQAPPPADVPFTNIAAAPPAPPARFTARAPLAAPAGLTAPAPAPQPPPESGAPPAASPAPPRADVVVLERKPVEPRPPSGLLPARPTAAPPPAEAVPPREHGLLSPVAGVVLVTLLVCGASVVLALLAPWGWPAAAAVGVLAGMGLCFGYLLTRTR